MYISIYIIYTYPFQTYLPLSSFSSSLYKWIKDHNICLFMSMLFILNYNKWYYYVKLLIYKDSSQWISFLQIVIKKSSRWIQMQHLGWKTMSIPLIYSEYKTSSKICHIGSVYFHPTAGPSRMAYMDLESKH